MIIDITGRHVSIDEALKEHAKEKLEHVLRHANDVISAHVILDVEKTRALAEMIVYGRHLTATVHADSEDLHTSIDRCAEKLRHQLEHHQGRRRDRRRKASRVEAEQAAIAQGLEGLAAVEDVEEDAPEPRVVRSKPTHVKPMTVDEASLFLSGREEEFVVFRDADSEQVHVLYRRKDGNLGLIETGAR